MPCRQADVVCEDEGAKIRRKAKCEDPGAIPGVHPGALTMKRQLNRRALVRGKDRSFGATPCVASSNRCWEPRPEYAASASIGTLSAVVTTFSVVLPRVRGRALEISTIQPELENGGMASPRPIAWYMSYNNRVPPLPQNAQHT